MDRLFKEKSEKIRIVLATEQVLDPYEKNVSFTELPSFPINAVVTDLTTTKAQYAMPGIVTSKVKEIIIEKKYESLLLKSYRIKVGNDYYIGWKQNGKMQVREEGQFLRVYIYVEKS